MAELNIVDTDVLIDASRGVEEAIECLKRIEEKRALAISAVTQMELIVGCRTKRELIILEKFLTRFYVFQIEASISLRATDLLLRYRLSHGLLIADALIAATAIQSKQSLVSKNQRDYSFIRGLKLLSYPELRPVGRSN